MAYMRLTQRSTSMNCNMDVAIFYPMPDHRKNTIEQIRTEKKKVLYLLHEKGELFLQWPLQSNLYEWAMEREIIIVMPTVRDYFSARLSTMGDVFAYISRELPQYIQTILPASDKREHNLIAGMGMGGYYALKVAATYPDHFLAAGAFSSLPDVKDYLNGQSEDVPEHMTPEEFEGSSNDVLGLLKKLKESGGNFPEIYLQCSPWAEEFDQNLAVCEWLRQQGITFEWSQENSMEKGVKSFADKKFKGILDQRGNGYGEDADL